MKITVKIEGAPESFNCNGAAREMLHAVGYEISPLHSITIKTDAKGATVATCEGEVRTRQAGDGPTDF